MKIKKQHRKKKFLFKLNRKRMHLKQRSTGDIKCKVLKDAWNNKKSSHSNLRDMGLATDPNKVIAIPNFKQEQLVRAKKIVNKVESDEEIPCVRRAPPKLRVAEKLEQEAKAPRERKFMLPKGQVEYVTYLLGRYGHDYKAMARDKKNYFQYSWKQLRAKLKTFIKIPKQYVTYLKSRGLLDKEENEDELKQQTNALIMDDSD